MAPSAFVILDAFPLNARGNMRRDATSSTVAERARSTRPHVAPRSSTEHALARIWCDVLGLQQVGIRESFFDLGGHSLAAVRLFSRIEQITGKRLPLVTLFEARTIAQLARLVDDSEWQPHWTSLVPIKPQGTNPPFYCVHGVGGNILEFEHVSRYIASEQPLYGIQAQGLDGKLPRHESVEEMAEHYVREIREFQPEGPYYLGGSSFGGLVAYEVTLELLRQGQEVGLLAMFDTSAPGYPRWLPEMTRWKRRLAHWQLRWDLHWGNIVVAKGPARREYVQTKLVRLLQDLWKRPRIASRVVKTTIAGWLHPQAIRNVRKGGHRALKKYDAKPFPGKVTLLRATQQPKGIYEDRTCGWSAYALGGVEVHDVPGHHGAIVREPRVRILAEKLNLCLAEAYGRAEARRLNGDGGRLPASGDARSRSLT
jgi:thioesterase domain-containing protein/acyl carrier protein